MPINYDVSYVVHPSLTVGKSTSILKTIVKAENQSKVYGELIILKGLFPYIVQIISIEPSNLNLQNLLTEINGL